jgi:hypothetical protein
MSTTTPMTLDHLKANGFPSWFAFYQQIINTVESVQLGNKFQIPVVDPFALQVAGKPKPTLMAETQFSEICLRSFAELAPRQLDRQELHKLNEYAAKLHPEDLTKIMPILDKLASLRDLLK